MYASGFIRMALPAAMSGGPGPRMSPGRPPKSARSASHGCGTAGRARGRLPRGWNDRTRRAALGPAGLRAGRRYRVCGGGPACRRLRWRHDPLSVDHTSPPLALAAGMGPATAGTIEGTAMLTLTRGRLGAGFLIAGILLFRIALAEFNHVRWAWRHHQYPDVTPAFGFGIGSMAALAFAGRLLRII